MRLLFIDANIYLHFIRTSNENMESLDELEKLINAKEIQLIFPKITRNEFLRHISLIALNFKKLIDEKVPSAPNLKEPKIIEVYKLHIKNIRELSSLYLQSVKSLRQRITKLQLSKLVEQLNETEDALKRAYYRKMKGDPPGKTGHIGDELVWEMLIEYCQGKNYDLSIITQDQGWKELMPESKNKILSPILEEEWKSISKGKIAVFNTIGEFINDFTGKQKISKEDIDLEKNIGIPMVYSGDQYFGPTFFTPPTFGAVSNISTPSVDQWQPITVAGGTQGLIQCYSCGRWVKPGEYYGFTANGFACKFCAET